jgi:hypothetical protein
MKKTYVFVGRVGSKRQGFVVRESIEAFFIINPDRQFKVLAGFQSVIKMIGGGVQLQHLFNSIRIEFGNLEFE